MNTDSLDKHINEILPFFEQEEVEVEIIPVGQGVPFGTRRVSNPKIGVAGIYGTWGEGYSNASLPDFLEKRLGEKVTAGDILDLSTLGFEDRHHISELTDEEHLEVEIAVGAKLLREAARANGWQPEEVEAVLIGMSGPVADQYVEKIAEAAGIPDSALKVSVHKACDGSVGALHLALNPQVAEDMRLELNIAKELYGKKILVGGIEGLSRFLSKTSDKMALQLFGNGAGVIGVIPGETMKFLVGKSHEKFDENGVLAVSMHYPHSGQKLDGQSMLEASHQGEKHMRIAGFMPKPADDSAITMAGPMGMVKLFVRTGVEIVKDVYQEYQKFIQESGTTKEISLAIAHHANRKINLLKASHLQRAGINLPMPWLLSEFGNVSAASNMIAFLKSLPAMKKGDHILIDGFGAGTYYDVLAVEMGD